MHLRIVQVFGFLVVGSLVTWGQHRYLWARLVRDPAWPEVWQRAGTWAVITLAVVMLAAMPLSRLLPRAAAAPLAWTAYIWMGTAFVLVVGVAGADLVRALTAAVGGVDDPERRRFLARVFAAAAGVGGLVASGLALRRGLGPWDVRTVRVALEGLPRGAEGMTLVQLSDIHVGPTIGRAFVEAMVRTVNDLRPDAVVITGDLVDGSVEALREHVAPLAGLRAKHGVYFVTGNHEYYSGVDDWTQELRRLGVRVLANERVALGDGDDAIDLAGIHDWSARRLDPSRHPDLGRALAGRDASRPVVLLAHQPKHIREAAAQGVSLVLSGHTHGGQIWPWAKVVGLDQPYVKGLHRHENTQIYVSEGTGYWGPPMRLGSAPEITRVVLTGSGARGATRG